MFFDFVVYGSWGPLDSLKILSRGVGTFSTPGEAIPMIFEKSIFLYISTINPSSGGGGVSLCLDLTIYGPKKKWDISRVVRNAL